MKQKLTEFTTINDLNKTFQSVYPFLKLRFSKHAHAPGEPNLKGRWFKPSTTLCSLMDAPVNEYIRIHSWNTAADVEYYFEHRFGLHVQVFRNESGRWIQTAGTDYILLSELNDIGKRSNLQIDQPAWIERAYIL